MSTFIRTTSVALAISLTAGRAMTQEQSGAVLGGATGAAAGSAIDKGGGRMVAIMLGALADWHRRLAEGQGGRPE